MASIPPSQRFQLADAKEEEKEGKEEEVNEILRGYIAFEESGQLRHEREVIGQQAQAGRPKRIGQLGEDQQREERDESQDGGNNLRVRQ
jgi:hypothetical protein